MKNRLSGSKRRARRAMQPSARASVAALVLAVTCGAGLTPPASAAGTAGTAGTAGEAGEAAAATENEARILGREALIGKLIPITGDPIEIRSVDLRVEFRINSAELTGDATAQLLELGAALTSEALRGAALGVYGHTDTSGRAEYNQALSERRAQAVAGFLREHFGIAPERFREVRGHGEERLREDLAPDAPAQRRVEIVTFHQIGSDGTDDSVTDVPVTEAPVTDVPVTEAPVSDAPGQSGGTAQEPVDGDGAVVRIGRDDETAADADEEEQGEDGGSGGYIAIQ